MKLAPVDFESQRVWLANKLGISPGEITDITVMDWFTGQCRVFFSDSRPSEVHFMIPSNEAKKRAMSWQESGPVYTVNLSDKEYQRYLQGALNEPAEDGAKPDLAKLSPKDVIKAARQWEGLRDFDYILNELTHGQFGKSEEPAPLKGELALLARAFAEHLAEDWANTQLEQNRAQHRGFGDATECAHALASMLNHWKPEYLKQMIDQEVARRATPEVLLNLATATPEEINAALRIRGWRLDFDLSENHT